MTGDYEDAKADWQLLDDRVTFEVIPREEGDLRVRFTDADNEVLWSAVYDRGFWESRTSRGEIGNKLAEHTSYAKTEVKDELEEVWTELTEHSEEYERELVSPSVQELIANTEAVEVHGGEATEFHVYVRARPYGEYVDQAETDGGASVRKLVFADDEWAKSDGDTQMPPVVQKYTNVFYEVLDISWEEWRDDIRPAWQRMQEIVSDDRLSTADRIAMSVVRSLRHQLDVHNEADMILNDTWNGWYQESSRHGEVVWVPGDTLDEALDTHDRGTDYRSALSRSLQNEGYTVGSRKQTTINGDPVELYPFMPETLGVDKLDIIGLDDEDDPGEGAPASDSGDGPDDGGTTGEDDGADGPATTDDPATSDADSSTSTSTPADASDERAADGGSAEGTDAQADTDGDGEVAAVVDVVRDLAPTGASVNRKKVVAEAAESRGLGPPDQVEDLLERAVLEDDLASPSDDTVALPSDGTDPPGDRSTGEVGDDGVIDTDEDGVPEP